MYSEICAEKCTGSALQKYEPMIDGAHVKEKADRVHFELKAGLELVHGHLSTYNDMTHLGPPDI